MVETANRSKAVDKGAQVQKAIDMLKKTDKTNAEPEVHLTFFFII